MRDAEAKKAEGRVSLTDSDTHERRGVCYSGAAVRLDGSARQTYKYFSSLEVKTEMFCSRVTRFNAERRFCILSPFSPTNGILIAFSEPNFERSARISDTAFRCFPFRPCGTSD